jgi:TRAP-type C4-dicarboxylate transport system permease small subunit
MARIIAFADALGAVASAAARVLLFAVAFILVLQVVLRFGFSYSLPWPEEAARYMMIWIVMLAGSLLVKDNQLVSVEFFDHLWPENWLVWRNAAYRLVLAALLVVLAWQGLDQALFAIRRTTTALQISWFWPYLAIPVGAALMLIQLAALTLREIASGHPVPEALPDGGGDIPGLAVSEGTEQ